MKYDFNQLLDRRPWNSSKWMKNSRPYQKGDLLPMPIADSDFATCQPAIDALKAYVEQGTYGYSTDSKTLIPAVQNWFSSRFGWKVEADWIDFNSGVMDGCFSVLSAMTQPGDSVIIQNPVYPPFYSNTKNSGCNIVLNPMKFNGKRYEMDFEQLESLFNGSQPKPKVLLLCSPHNATGRVWSLEELKKLTSILIKHDCYLISDEMHFDIVRAGVKHHTMGSLGPEIEQRMAVMSAGSKTFNLAGLRTSYIVIPNVEIREKYKKFRIGRAGGNYMGKLALEACYTDGVEWLEQMNAHIDSNLEYMVNAINTRCAPLKCCMPEGTYLLWIDCRGLKKSQPDLMKWLLEDLQLVFNDGSAFGEGGEGFIRVNVACPIQLVEEAAERLEAGIRKLNLK